MLYTSAHLHQVFEDILPWKLTHFDVHNTNSDQQVPTTYTTPTAINRYLQRIQNLQWSTGTYNAQNTYSDQRVPTTYTTTTVISRYCKATATKTNMYGGQQVNAP